MLLLGETLVELLDDGLADAVVLGEGDHGSVTLANDEDVGQTGGERVTSGVLDVDNFEAARVLLQLGDDADTADVSAASDLDQVANLEGDSLDNLAGLEVELDGVVRLDVRVGVSDGSAVVRGEVRDVVLAEDGSADTAQLELGLLRADSVDDIAALGVVQETEVLVGLLDRDDVHVASRVARVAADLAVDLDELLQDDEGHLAAGERVFEAVTEQDHHGEALTEFVGSVARARSKDTAHLAEHPVLRRVNTLQVLDKTSGLLGKKRKKRKINNTLFLLKIHKFL